MSRWHGTKADDVLKHFHRLDEWLQADEAKHWFRSFMQQSFDRYSKTQRRLMFGTAANPNQFRQDLRADLFKARLYQVTDEMVRMTTASWDNVKTDVSGLAEWNLPSPWGWAWLDGQFTRRGDDGEEMGVSAISWGLVPDILPDITGGRPVSGVRIATWHWTGDVNHAWTAERAAWWLAAHGHHDLVFTHSAVVPFESTIMPPTSGGEDVIRWVKVLWALMDAEITTEQRAGIGAYPMKRHRERFEGKDPELTVILLRRVTPKPGEPTGVTRHIDWSLGRIVVQGYHRHVRVNPAHPRHHALPDPANASKTCRTCGNEITWVHAHLKGPDGLPIRNAEQLWVLAR